MVRGHGVERGFYSPSERFTAYGVAHRVLIDEARVRTTFPLDPSEDVLQGPRLCMRLVSQY